MIDGKPIYKQKWEFSGIERIMDLLENNGQFKSLEQIENLVHAPVDILFYNGLKAAIPSFWMKLIKREHEKIKDLIQNREETDLTIKIEHKYIKVKDVKCKDIYWEEINKKSMRPTSYYKWESEYYYVDFDWTKINKIPYICARETHLQSLQFQILNRFYPCGYMLNIWKINSDNKCKICLQIDTLEHYFTECIGVQMFWEAVKNWFTYHFEFRINFSPLDILFGIPNIGNNNELTALNFVILFAKSFIKQCKVNESHVNFPAFIKKLKERMATEKYIHVLNDTLIEFATKWETLFDSLN